jgi:uncharacterized protein YdeI (YjbR/CyaY-like superfamily)
MAALSPNFFPSAAAFRAWLEKHHASTPELIVGFYKKSSGRAGLTYPEAIDEALCFGWIDGIVRKLDDERYSHRFTPRKTGSIWSNVNVRHVARLTAAGRMHAAGLAAFAARSAAKTGIYSFEAKVAATLPPAFEKKLRANQKAWAFFNAQAPWYQRKVTWWVVKAKQEETRARRLAKLIAGSAAGRQV